MKKHKEQDLRDALCGSHGGFEQATVSQLMSLYMSLSDEEREAIDMRITGDSKSSRKPPSPKEDADAEITG